MDDIKFSKRTRNGVTYVTATGEASYNQVMLALIAKHPDGKITSGGYGAVTCKLPVKEATVWPTEVVAKAEFEIGIFERPSVETCRELIEEVKILRALLADANRAEEKARSDAGWAADAARMAQDLTLEWK